jgi:hypothetical protein
MAKFVYRVVPEGEKWIVRHEGDFADEVVGDSVPYVTKEAAFEAAVAAIANTISKGHAVELSIEGGEGRWS